MTGKGATRDAAALIREVAETVGPDERVLLGISGGVDSSTLGLLLSRAVGSRLFAVFVDHGLLRAGEAREVVTALTDLGVNLVAVDAADRFLTALAGVADPEAKRKIIGGEFVAVFREEAERLRQQHGRIRYLAQGTLYPDVVESHDEEGNLTVKSHHNVGGLPAELGFELLEPFRSLYKEDVREIAAQLGLPEGLRQRHPFPGPGLAVRCLGEVTRERLETLRAADAEFIAALREHGLYDHTWQALTVLAPVRTVGVGAGGRRYGAQREFLAEVSNRILEKVPGVNRVVYDLTPKPPGTIEWE